MKKYKKICLLLVVVAVTILPGCWDSIEINERAFILGIGLDKGEKPDELEVTYETALPSKLAKPSGDEEKGGGEGTATFDITKKFSTVLHTMNTTHENIDKVIDLQHMKLLVIGNEVAKEGIIDDVDIFFRDPQMRRRTKIVFTEDEAKDILKNEPKTTKSPSIFINNILNTNIRYTNTINPSIDLGVLVQNIRDGFDFVITRVKADDKKLVIDGAGAFKDGKLVSMIEKEEIKVIAWMTNDVIRSAIQIPDPQNPIYQIVYNISRGDGNLKPIFTDDKVNFSLDLKVEGDIAEAEDTNYLGTLEPQYLDSIERAVEDKIKAEIIATFNKYEKEVKVDIFHLKRKIKNYNIKFYDRYKERLNDKLAEADIDVKVDARVRRVGLTK